MSPSVNILIETLAPTALVMGVAYSVLPWVSSRNELARAAAVAVMIGFMWRYLLWRWTSTLPPFAWSLDCIVGLVFVIVETLAVVGSTLSLVTLARLKSRSGEVDRNAAWLAGQPRPPLVDVFICTYNEGETILERTIVGALELDYEAKRVWVLDDSRRTWLRDLSERLGARYLTRPDNEGAKADNMIARIGRDEFAVQFERDDAARSSIIRHIYSGRYSTQIERIQPSRVAAAIFSRLVR